MRAILVSFLLLPLFLISAPDACEGAAAAGTPSAGSITLPDGTVIPPYPKNGRWTELPGKTSERYETCHFLYLVPGESPAIELYTAVDRRNQPPDGLFEMGLVKGFLSGFASKAGLRVQAPVFEERRLGPVPVRRASSRLSDATRALWVYAYIFPRRVSLTFIAIRPTDEGREQIDAYLQTLDLRCDTAGVAARAALPGRPRPILPSDAPRCPLALSQEDGLAR
jgi:hypothetical protein